MLLKIQVSETAPESNKMQQLTQKVPQRRHYNLIQRKKKLMKEKDFNKDSFRNVNEDKEITLKKTKFLQL